MTPEQLDQAAIKRAELLDALSGAGEAQAKARAVILAKMALSYPIAGNAGAAAAEARGEAYRDALDDMPAWAVAEGVRIWNRGQAGAQNYSFAPPPAVLRNVVEGILAPYRRALNHVEAALNALTIDEAMDSKPLPQKNSLIPNFKVVGRR